MQTNDTNNLAVQRLNDAIESKEMLQIYTDCCDTQKFSVGFVQALTDTELMIAHVTPYGKYDGYLVKQLKDIYRVEAKSQYIAKLETLYAYHKQEHALINQTESSLFTELLIFALNNKKIVSLELLESGNDDVVGFVDSIENTAAAITIIDSYGKKDGTCYINISDITHAVCDSENEIALNILTQTIKQ